MNEPFVFDANSARGDSLPSLCWPVLIEVQIVSWEFYAVNAVKIKSNRSDIDQCPNEDLRFEALQKRNVY